MRSFFDGMHQILIHVPPYIPGFCSIRATLSHFFASATARVFPPFQNQIIILLKVFIGIIKKDKTLNSEFYLFALRGQV